LRDSQLDFAISERNFKYVPLFHRCRFDSRKSTTGFVFTLCGTAVSWASKLQKSVTIEKLKLCAASVGL
jgi:hypothetical protein